jgi:CelD/BcsL family acetyltransferase involved in cellulose biosynthesis
VRWRLLPARTAFGELRPRWDALNRELHGGHPLLDTRFVAPLLEHFGSARVRVAACFAADALRAAALVEPSSPLAWRTFLPSQAPIAPVLFDPSLDAVAGVFSAMPPLVRQFDFLQQDPPHSAVAGREEGARVGPHVCRRSRHALTIAADLADGFDAYWEARSRSLRKNMRRYQNRVESAGAPLELRTLESAPQVLEGLRRYGLLESAGWKGARGTAIHPDNAQGRFYADVLGGFAASGDALVAELLLGERPIASRLCVRSGGMLVILKTTYDETAAEFAPGRLLLLRLLQWVAQERRAGVVEFYTNATEEQRAWATDEREIFHLTCRRTRLDDAILGWAASVRARRSGRADAERAGGAEGGETSGGPGDEGTGAVRSGAGAQPRERELEREQARELR